MIKQAESFSWKKDLFDSKILNRIVAKIEILKSTKLSLPSVIKKLTNDFKKNKIDYAVYRFPATQITTIHALEKEGFILVDCSVALEMKLKEKLDDIPKEIRHAKLSDLSKLQKLARNSFYLNRFYNDPLIPKKQADEIYAEWIKNSLKNKQADAIFVWEEKKQLYGFTTVKKNGNIVLIAVDSKQRGKGIAKYLVKRSLNQFVEWGIDKATIETQMTNIPALRAYQACGFKISDAFVTYRWSKE